MSHKNAWPALLLLFAGAVTPTARADLYQAHAAADKGEYTRAFELYRELAELGHPVAQEALAVMYVNGEGVERDNILGFAWATLVLEQAADSEAARNIVAQLKPHLSDTARERVAAIRAQFGTGALQASLLPDPIPVPANLDAGRCRMKSAGNPDFFYPAAARVQGIGGEALVQVWIEADGSVRLPQAEYSFPPQIFEEAGRAVALHSRFTPRIVDGVHVPCSMRFKVKFWVGENGKDRPSATQMKVVKELWTKAQQGDPLSQLYYGLAWSLREEYRFDGQKSRDWTLKAAQAGLAPAQYLVGVSMITADEQAQAKGVRWLEMSANAGNGAAMASLARYRLRSQDPQLRSQGFDWMQRSAATTHREGKFLFAALLVGWPDSSRRDPARAMALIDEVSDAFDYDPLVFEIRAAAFAAQGDFEKAERMQTRAVSKANQLGWDTAPLKKRREAYQQGRTLDQELVSF